MLHKNRTFLTVTLVLWVCALILVGCDSNSDEANAVSEQGAKTNSTASALGAKSADPIVPSAWKTVSDGKWTFSIPEEWNEESGLYHPEGAVSSSTGIPYIFCVTGIRGLAKPDAVDDDLKMIIGFGPLTKTPMTVCGQDGYMAEGSAGIALFHLFEPRAGPGSKFAIDAIWCKASSSSRFSQYEAIFRHIIESVDCSSD